MLFLINFKFAADTASYFSKGFDSVVVHLWSISVEIQFYILIPLIFLIVNQLNRRKDRIVVFSFLIALSFVSSFFTRPNHSFYLLHYRLYELVAGVLVQEVETALQLRRDHQSENTVTVRIIEAASILITCILLWLLSQSIPMDDFVFRIVILLNTSLIILCTGFSQNKLLRMKWLVYIGDISYVLYLIHWPVIVFTYSWALIDNDTAKKHYIFDNLAMICLIISIFLSIIIHHAFEKPLSKQPAKECLAISAVLYMCTLIALGFRHQCSERIIKFQQSDNHTLYNLMEWNYQKSQHCCNSIPEDCTSDKEAWKWIAIKEEKIRGFPWVMCTSRANGTLSVLVLGNSVSSSSFETVHRSLNGRYKELRLFTKSGCSILAGLCDIYWSKVVEMVERMNPDIIMITEYGGYMNERADDPTVLQNAQKRVDYLRNHSRAVMVDTDYLISEDFPYSLALSHSLARGIANMASIPRPSIKSLLQSHKAAFDRMNSIRGVILNNITFALCQREDGVCEGYNPATLKSYTERDIHLNAYGYELLESTYRRTIDSVLKIVSTT